MISSRLRSVSIEVKPQGVHVARLTSATAFFFFINHHLDSSSKLKQENVKRLVSLIVEIETCCSGKLLNSLPLPNRSLPNIRACPTLINSIFRGQRNEDLAILRSLIFVSSVLSKISTLPPLVTSSEVSRYLCPSVGNLCRIR